MREEVLRGPDGTNPLGFLCAAGLLRVLHERARGEPPQLSWRDEGYWRPVLHLPQGYPDPVRVVIDDLATWRNDPPELNLVYQTERKHKSGKKVTQVRDLRVPPEVFRRIAKEASDKATQGNRRLADFLAAYGSDIVRDKTTKGNTKPTAFHFTAGNQQFLEIVTRPKFPLPQEGMALIFLAKACLGAQAFWLQGEGDPEQIEGALLQRGRHRDFVELDRRV